jgi:hypothetical protein
MVSWMNLTNQNGISVLQKNSTILEGRKLERVSPTRVPNMHEASSVY